MNAARPMMPGGPRWSGSLIVTTLAVLVGGWMILYEAVPALMTLLVPGADDSGESAIDRALEKHQDLLATSKSRFNGRSLFVMPSPPARKASPAPPPPPPPPVDLTPALPPPAPTEYGGAKPKGMVGETVFFDSFTIRVGEEKNGIKIIGLEPPSNVRIEHMRGTYSVPVWEGSDWGSLASPAPRSSSSPIKAAPTSTPAQTRETPRQPAEVAVVVVETPAAPTLSQEAEESSPDADDAPRETPREVVVSIPPAPYSTARPLPGAPTVLPTAAVPLPMSPSQIASLTPAQVGAAISQISRARRMEGLDPATQARLREEFDALRVRQGTMP